MRDGAWRASPARAVLRCIAALLLVGAGRAGAQPFQGPLVEEPPPAQLRAAWEEAGRPVVLILPDHLGLDARAALYARALRDAGLSVVALDLPPWPGNDGWSHLLPAAPDSPGAAEAMLPLLGDALRRINPEGLAPGAGPRRRIGVLGLGPGGEAALLAAHAGTLGGALGFAAHAALYPTCAGPRLPALRAADAPTTGAPVLAIIPHSGGAGDMPGGCAILFDAWEPLRPERVMVLPFDSLGYGFDLWAAAGLEAARRAPGDRVGGDPGRRETRAGIDPGRRETRPGIDPGRREARPGPDAGRREGRLAIDPARSEARAVIDPLRFDVLRTVLARDALVRFFRAALVPATVESPVAIAGAARSAGP